MRYQYLQMIRPVSDIAREYTRDDCQIKLNSYFPTEIDEIKQTFYLTILITAFTAINILPSVTFDKQMMCKNKMFYAVCCNWIKLWRRW